MNKQEKNKERIEIIKEERYELLNEVRESINNGNNAVIENAESIVEALDYDEKNIKKYEALKEAQFLIENLTVEIANATTKEEVEALRKKLNYYINKIKNEAKKRNIDYSEYYESVTSIRKNIAKYIRFIKRRDQIEELEKINEMYDELDKEAKKKLSRQISSARNYNTRVIREQKIQNGVVLVKNNENVQENIKKDIEEVLIDTKEGKNNIEVSVIDSKENSEPKVTLEEHHDVDFVLVGYNDDNLNDVDPVEDVIENKGVRVLNNVNEEPTKALIVVNRNVDNYGKKAKLLFQDEEIFASDRDYVSSRVEDFESRYRIDNALGYSSSIGKNFVTFVKNIPIYNANKKKLRRIARDYELYYHSDDLGVFMEYIRRDNSIIEGLKKIFKKSSLYTKEDEFLDNHDRCVNWILSFVKDNEIRLNYRLAK